MAKTTRHLTINIKGALRNKFFSGWEDEGRNLTRQQAQLKLLQHKAKGHKYLPANGKECEGWSYETGCPGHPAEEKEVTNEQ